MADALHNAGARKRGPVSAIIGILAAACLFGGNAQAQTCNTDGCSVNLGSNQYVLNNMWNKASDPSGTQSVTVNSGTNWSTTYNWPDTAPAYAVRSYPSAILGWQFALPRFGNTGLPVLLSNHTPINSTTAFNIVGTDECADVAYDCWFHSMSNPSASTNPTDEMMIWEWYKYTTTGIGTLVKSGIAIDGYNWDLYEGWNSFGWEVHSFLIQGGGGGPTGGRSFGATLNVTDFTNYLVANSYGSAAPLLSSRYFTGLEFGTEPVWTSGTMTTNVTNYTVSVGAVQGPFGGTPAAIPGTVSFTNYDNGGEGLAYHDTDAANLGGTNYRPGDGVDIGTGGASGGNGYLICYCNGGEWMKYTVNVASAGNYNVTFNMANGGTTASTFHLENNSGTNLTGTLSLPPTGGWGNYSTVTKTISLPAGTQILKFCEDSGGYNISHMTFASAQGPYGGTAVSLPGTVNFTNFDTGGEGVAYHDADSANQGGTNYRPGEWVDIGTGGAPGGNGFLVCYCYGGEWMKYTVNATTAKTYTITFKMANGGTTTSTFHIENNSGTNLSGTVSVPPTGGWGTYSIITKTVTLSAGIQTLKFCEDSGGYNISHMTFN